jgi:hypothetical protein
MSGYKDEKGKPVVQFECPSNSALCHAFGPLLSKQANRFHLRLLEELL